jgi:hypothetical protein
MLLPLKTFQWGRMWGQKTVISVILLGLGKCVLVFNKEALKGKKVHIYIYIYIYIYKKEIFL